MWNLTALKTWQKCLALLIISLLTPVLHAEDVRLTVVAGSGPTGMNLGDYAGDEGPAVAARFNMPADVAVDRAGNVYVADSRNHVIRQIRPDGIVVTVAGTGEPGYNGDDLPGRTAQLSFPAAVAVDRYGMLYIADAGNDRIRRLTPTGRLRDFAGNGQGGYSGDGGPALAAELDAPTGLALDAHGNLYVAERNNSVVRKITPHGVILPVAGNPELWPDAQWPAPNGNEVPALEAALWMPSGLALGRDGTVFIADTANNRIRSVTPDGMLHTVAGNGPVGLNQSIFKGDDRLAVNVHLNLPEDVVRDSVGNLYVADTDNERIRRIDPAGHITTLLAADAGYFAGMPSPLGYVQGLGIDAQGNVYVADSGNHRIYKLWLEDRCEGRAWYRAEDGHLHLPLIRIDSPWGVSLFAVQADLYHLGYTRQGRAAFGIGGVDLVTPQATPEVPPCHAVYQVLDGTLHVPRLDTMPGAPEPVLPVLDDVGHHSSIVTTDLQFRHGLFVVDSVHEVR